MSRRIEIEITSLQGDVATWRAAGAKLPKGVLSASLVPGAPVVGQVYRAEVEQYMEGMEVLAVYAPKTASPLDPRHERLELLPSVHTGPDVVVTYAPKGRGPRRDDDVRARLGNWDQFDSLVTRVQRGRGLRRHNREHFHALHVLLDVRAIDVADYRTTGHEVGIQNTLGQLGAGRAPRSDVALQTGDFDLNATRHRFPI